MKMLRNDQGRAGYRLKVWLMEVVYGPSVKYERQREVKDDTRFSGLSNLKNGIATEVSKNVRVACCREWEIKSSILDILCLRSY